MIVDVYQFFKHHPRYNKLVGDDYLFVEYKCPLNVEKFKLWTESHLITFVISGQKDWITPQKTYELKSGDALFVRKGVYTTRQHFEEDYCVMLFFMTDDFIKKFLLDNENFVRKIDAQENFNPVFEIHSNPSFQSLMESIFHYLSQSGNIPQNLVELKFQELLFNIALNPRNKELLHFFNSVNKSVKREIEDVMIKNFQYDLKLEDFAKLCGRSLSSFKRDFKTYFDTTPSKWLSNRRLEHAKTLLLGSDLSISEICFESGFKNASHFNRAFKSKYALPPNQFKSAHSG